MYYPFSRANYISPYVMRRNTSAMMALVFFFKIKTFKGYILFIAIKYWALHGTLGVRKFAEMASQQARLDHHVKVFACLHNLWHA